MITNKNSSSIVDSGVPVQKRPTLFESFKILLGYIFVILFIQSLVSFVLVDVVHISPAGSGPSNIAGIANILPRFFGLVSSACFAFYMVRRYFPAPTLGVSFAQIGLLHCSNRFLGMAVILGIVFVLVFEFWLPRKYPADPSLLANFNMQSDEGSVGEVFLLAVITVGIAPIVEEIFFRGLLYQVIVDATGKLISALVVTTVFVLLHYQVFSYWVAFVSLLTGSIALIVIREVSASLIPGILLHQIHNLGVRFLSE